jgi:flagellar assembly protein FliH
VTTSSSETAPREQMSAWQRWELGSIDPRSAQGQQEADAQRDRIAREAAALSDAREAGYAAGYAEAAAERARLAELVGQLGVQAADHEQRLCDEVLDLALALARHMVGATLAARRELVLPVVGAALRRLPQSAQRVDLFLNPADVELVRSHLSDEDPGPRCRIAGDPAVAPGGCRIATEQTDIDMTTGLRWQRLLNQFGRADEWLTLA